MTLDDQKRLVSLWMQFLDGNEIAFSQLYCLFFDDLLTYGRRVGGDNEMVEDLIQDLFLKLYQKKITLEDNTRLRPFLFRALKNLIYNQLLRNSKLQPLPDYDFSGRSPFRREPRPRVRRDGGCARGCVRAVLRAFRFGARLRGRTPWCASSRVLRRVRSVREAGA